MNILKRSIDLVLTVLTLVLLSPVLIGTAILVRIYLGKPIIYRAERVGLNGQVFTLYKFRSMVDLTDEQGNQLPDSDRLTPFGEFLRKASLDELPGLFNVLRGDMSIVGPRPLSSLYKDMYSPDQNRRHNVRPGITGWSQVNGRNNLTWEEKFDLDVWYVENFSLLLDLKILVKTIKTVFTMQNVSQSGHVTARPWTGNSDGSTVGTVKADNANSNSVEKKTLTENELN